MSIDWLGTLSLSNRQWLRRPEAGFDHLRQAPVQEAVTFHQLLVLHLGRELVLPRYTQPEPEHRLLLEKLGRELPAQSPRGYARRS